MKVKVEAVWVKEKDPRQIGARYEFWVALIVKDSVREKAEIRFMAFPKHLAVDPFDIREPSREVHGVEPHGWACQPTAGQEMTLGMGM